MELDPGQVWAALVAGPFLPSLSSLYCGFRLLFWWEMAVPWQTEARQNTLSMGHPFLPSETLLRAG